MSAPRIYFATASRPGAKKIARTLNRSPLSTDRTGPDVGPSGRPAPRQRTSSRSLAMGASSGAAAIANRDCVVVRFSTADYPPRQRFDAWREIYGRTLQRLDIE